MRVGKDVALADGYSTASAWTLWQRYGEPPAVVMQEFKRNTLDVYRGAE